VALVTGCRRKPSGFVQRARFMSAGTRVACAFGGPHGLLRARELDSVGVGEMRAPAARPAAFTRTGVI
jgi:hypothetical protein